MKFKLLTLFLILPIIAAGEESDMPISIKEVKEQYEVQLLQLPGVVSVGIGRDDNGKPAIVVGLERSNPATEAQLPHRLEGYPVVLTIVGQIKSQ